MADSKCDPCLAGLRESTALIIRYTSVLKVALSAIIFFDGILKSPFPSPKVLRYIQFSGSTSDLPAWQAQNICVTNFPRGRLHAIYRPYETYSVTVRTGHGQLLPGTYQYVSQNGGERVTDSGCVLYLNHGSDEETVVEMIYGEVFRFSLYTYHNRVRLDEYDCNGYLYRIGN